MDDMTILRRAWELENDDRDRRHKDFRNWFFYSVGASREDIKRLLDDGLICKCFQNSEGTRYKLTEKGRKVIWATNMERQISTIPASTVMEAMEIIVGFDDVKERMARVIEKRDRVHFLMIGPPACAKSLFLEAIRSSVPGAVMVFGSQTSASGLSDVLFNEQPEFLLADELDKMHWDAYSIMLALLERGEILVTKSQNTRGIQLETIVFAACNKADKMPPELLSRFVQLYFPQYTRDEFINVCCGYLSRSENCLPELATMIGRLVYDYDLGDVRTARKVYKLLRAPTQEEVNSAVEFLRKYGVEALSAPKRQIRNVHRLPGL